MLQTRKNSVKHQPGSICIFNAPQGKRIDWATYSGKKFKYARSQQNCATPGRWSAQFLLSLHKNTLWYSCPISKLICLIAKSTTNNFPNTAGEKSIEKSFKQSSGSISMCGFPLQQAMRGGGHQVLVQTMSTWQHHHQRQTVSWLVKACHGSSWLVATAAAAASVRQAQSGRFSCELHACHNRCTTMKGQNRIPTAQST